MLVRGTSIMRSVHKTVGAVLGLSLLLGATADAKPLNSISDFEVYERLKQLQHMPWAGKAVERSNGWFSGCRKSTITLTVDDPLTMESRDFEFVMIRPDSKRPVPVAMVVPTMEGVTAVERTITANLCAMNIASIVTDVNQNTVPEVIPFWGFEDLNNRRAILAVRTLIDYIEATPYFDRRKIVMIGSSLGGITTSFLAGVETERINSFVIVVGGGNLPYTIAYTDNDRLSELRDLRMAAEGWTDLEQYEDKLRETMKFDPLYFTRFAHREKLFMVLSKADTTVPTLVQEDLFRAFGSPKHTYFNVGHVPTVIGVAFFYFDYVADFLSQRLNVPAFRKRGPQPVPEIGRLPVPLPQFQN